MLAFVSMGKSVCYNSICFVLIISSFSVALNDVKRPITGALPPQVITVFLVPRLDFLGTAPHFGHIPLSFPPKAALRHHHCRCIDEEFIIIVFIPRVTALICSCPLQVYSSITIPTLCWKLQASTWPIHVY